MVDFPASYVSLPESIFGLEPPENQPAGNRKIGDL